MNHWMHNLNRGRNNVMVVDMMHLMSMVHMMLHWWSWLRLALYNPSYIFQSIFNDLTGFFRDITAFLPDLQT